MRLHLQFVTIPIQRLGFSGGLQEITPCSYITPSQPVELPTSSPTPPAATDTLMAVAPKCCSSLVFEKPFHISLFMGLAICASFTPQGSINDTHSGQYSQSSFGLRQWMQL